MIESEYPEFVSRISSNTETDDRNFSKTEKITHAQAYLDDPLYDCKEAAIYITPPQRKRPYSIGTLAVWRCTKRYDLQPIKINGEVYYRKSSLDRFLRERLKP